jgi:hypothetical protein
MNDEAIDKTQSKFARLRERIVAFRTDAGPWKMPSDTFIEIFEDSMEIAAKSGVTEKSLQNAPKSLLTEEAWTTGTKHLHLTRIAGETIARICDVVMHKEIVPDERHGEMEVMIFTGFLHDVERALTMMDLVHAHVESQWHRVTQSKKYINASHSDQVVMRTERLRSFAKDAASTLTKKSVKQFQARIISADGSARIKRSRAMQFRNEKSAA